MWNRLTLLQGLLMLLAVLAIGTLWVYVQDQAPERVGESAPVDSTSAAPVDVTANYVRTVTATSDSLHDASAAMVEWIQATPDTTGLSERTGALEALVDRAMGRLLENPGAVSLEEVELVSSLYLDYLEAPSLLEVEPSFRPQAATDYLRGLEEARSEIEGRLLRYIGVF